jgi:tRNA-dihydrouridine synthase
MIAVHARTRTQAFKGKADWLLIKDVKEAASIPVVGNGDVMDSTSYRSMLEMTGCDAVMIGRWAIGNPWIFGEIKAAIEGREYSGPTARVRVMSLLSHVRASAANDGEPLGLIETRRTMAAYLKHVPNARDVRARIMTCNRLDELEDVLGSYVDWIDRGFPGDPAAGPSHHGISPS